MRLLARLIRSLLARRRPTSRLLPPIDPERLQQIYRETHREVENLRRAA